MCICWDSLSMMGFRPDNHPQEFAFVATGMSAAMPIGADANSTRSISTVGMPQCTGAMHSVR